MIVKPLDGTNSFDIMFAAGTSVRDRGTMAAALVDGNYQLTIGRDGVTSSTGNTLPTDHTFGDDFDDDFFALFGDNDGDGEVEGRDFFDLVDAFLGINEYDPRLDFDGDGSTNLDFDDAFAFIDNLFSDRRPLG